MTECDDWLFLCENVARGNLNVSRAATIYNSTIYHDSALSNTWIIT